MMMSAWSDMKMGGRGLGGAGTMSSPPPQNFGGRYSPTYRVPEHQMREQRRCVTNPPADLFSGLNESILSRESLVPIDMKHPVSPGPLPPTSVTPITHIKQDMMYHTGIPSPQPSNGRPHQEIFAKKSGYKEEKYFLEPCQQMDSHGMDLLNNHMNGSPMPGLNVSDYGIHPGMYQNGNGIMSPHSLPHHFHPGPQVAMTDMDTDPRELEAFAERFKQRRIKLGETQGDVGKTLANLKLPGVGSLSQSTICRFESLTLSHNNMIALKPILSAWLEEAEAARRDPESHGMPGQGDKKRKRTSIAAPEKRSLEAYFAVQPRPSGEKIAAIADKLDLMKNVVRVWFCNQRQKQKRMKFAAQVGGL